MTITRPNLVIYLLYLRLRKREHLIYGQVLLYVIPIRLFLKNDMKMQCRYLSKLKPLLGEAILLSLRGIGQQRLMPKQKRGKEISKRANAHLEEQMVSLL